jgi:hypothetical protein
MIARKPDNIQRDHNTVPMVFYSDSSCTNEFISSKPQNPDIPYEDKKAYNEPNRAVDPHRYVLPYTDIKAVPYVAPSSYSNARYYRSFRPNYPKNIDGLPDGLPPQR